MNEQCSADYDFCPCPGNGPLPSAPMGGSLFAEFAEALSRAREERIAATAIQHFQVSHGGVIQVPEYDTQRRIVVDEQGRPKMVPVVMLPNARAMQWELAHMDPETYGSRARDADSEHFLPPPEHAKPSELMDMFISVARRMAAMGDRFEPIETTARKVAIDEKPAETEEEEVG